MLPVASASKTFIEKLLAYGVAAKSNAPAGVPEPGVDRAKAGTAGVTMGVPVTVIFAVLAYLAANIPPFVAWLATLGVSPKVLAVLTGFGGLTATLSVAGAKYWGLVASGPRITLDPNDPARHDPEPATTPVADTAWTHPIDGILTPPDPPTVQFRAPGDMQGDGPL